MKAYSVLPKYYEYLMADCDYEKWSQYLSSGILRFAKGKSGADIGCGSGVFTRALSKCGFDVYGVDVSPEMLCEAVRMNGETGMRLTYVLQDAAAFRPMKKLDFVTAVTDCFNYLSPARLGVALKRIHAGLKKGGVLYFDVSSEKKLRHTLADNVFCEDGEEVSYIWFNTLQSDSVKMELTFFVKESDGKYARYEEEHVQYIYTETELLKMLETAGFETLLVEGFLGQEDKKDSERIHVFARAK